MWRNDVFLGYLYGYCCRRSCKELGRSESDGRESRELCQGEADSTGPIRFWLWVDAALRDRARSMSYARCRMLDERDTPALNHEGSDANMLLDLRRSGSITACPFDPCSFRNGGTILPGWAGRPRGNDTRYDVQVKQYRIGCRTPQQTMVEAEKERYGAFDGGRSRLASRLAICLRSCWAENGLFPDRLRYASCRYVTAVAVSPRARCASAIRCWTRCRCQSSSGNASRSVKTCLSKLSADWGRSRERCVAACSIRVYDRNGSFSFTEDSARKRRRVDAKSESAPEESPCSRIARAIVVCVFNT